MNNLVRLPKNRVHRTPMPVKTDAYTSGSFTFQSIEGIMDSIYYATHRKSPQTFQPEICKDDRIIIVGMRETVESVLFEACTIKDVNDSADSLEFFRVTKTGMKAYPFPKDLWLEVAEKYEGRPPILIQGVRDGTVVYPHEPYAQVRPCPDAPKRFGELAAWFEGRILHTYSTSERVTVNEHFLLRLKERILSVDPEMPDDLVEFHASNLLVDFSDRAGFNQTECDDMGQAHLYTFPGTDNLSGNFQAFMNSGRQCQGCSILALAHRNVQGHKTENACFIALNNVMDPGDLASFVADCNDYYDAIEQLFVPLIQGNIDAENNKTVIPRPDSGNVIEQLIWTLRKFHAAGFSRTEVRGGKEWKTSDHFKLILADGLTMVDMLAIIDAVIAEGWLFWEISLFGSGGGLRNLIKRDNFSSKYALNAKGENHEGVCKFSEDVGKGTLPGPLKLLRSPEALASCVTIVAEDEPGESILEIYFNGTDIWNPFNMDEGPMQDSEDFPRVKQRIKEQMKNMPLTMTTSSNGGVPCSALILQRRKELMHIHAPKKFEKAYGEHA